jgi:triosephosphate isomerase
MIYSYIKIGLNCLYKYILYKFYKVYYIYTQNILKFMISIIVIMNNYLYFVFISFLFNFNLIYSSISYRTPLVIGNWKMNTNIDTAIELSNYLLNNKDIQYNDIEVGVLPPIPFLINIKHILKKSNIKVGAQSVFHQLQGPYTGKVSSLMLNSVGCDYILVGHSERRNICKETDSDINMILKSIYKTNITPILCIGETKLENELNIQREIIKIQLTKSLDGLNPDQVQKIIIAYEPIWAIGTGISATPEITESMHLIIRNLIKKKYGSIISDSIRIIYGGSVTSNNAENLIKCANIDGFLVGTSSLNYNSFSDIINTTRNNNYYSNYLL